MNTFKPALLASRCSICARKRVVNPFNNIWGRRAAHSKRPPRTLVVRLLKAVKTYGDEGTLVPVPPGRMRNIWFPQRMADYLTRPELEAVKKKRGLQSIVRDFNYGLDWDKEEIESENIHDPKNEEIRPAKKNSIIEGLHLSPQRTWDLLRVLIPTKLHFQRQPILPQASSEMSADKSTFSDTAAISSKASTVTDASIYGSVNALDVLNLIRSLLANNEEASRIILYEDNIHFLNVRGDDDKRLKHLGEFLINISVNGLPEAQRIKKIIKITPILADGLEAEGLKNA